MNNGSTHPWGDTMIGFIKLTAIGVVLSCGATAVYNLPARKLDAALAGKLQDRLPDSGAAGFVPVRQAAAVPVGLGKGKGDRLVPSHASCAQLTGSSLPTACLARRDDAASRVVRIVTIESRDAANTSTLTRAPSITTAQR